jgi:hypothetical protein
MIQKLRICVVTAVRLSCIVSVFVATVFAPLRSLSQRLEGNANSRIESSEFETSAGKDTADRSIHIRRKRTGEEFAIPIPNDVHHVEELFPGAQNRVPALAAHDNLGQSAVMLVVDVDRRTIVDELVGALFSISPYGRFVTFFEWQPAHYDSGTSTLFYAYDVAASSFENHSPMECRGCSYTRRRCSIVGFRRISAMNMQVVRRGWMGPTCSLLETIFRAKSLSSPLISGRGCATL